MVKKTVSTLSMMILVSVIPPMTCHAQKSARTIISDIDGNSYNIITIGKQVWMKENLSTTHYRNGDLIDTSIPDTLNLTEVPEPKFQYPPMSDERNVATYGRLYTWYAATDPRGICPNGWHLPSDTEFCILENYLEPGVDPECSKTGHRGKNTGGMLKEGGLTHWTLPNEGSDNRSRFTGLPAGIRYLDGVFTFLGSYAYFWTSSPCDSTTAWSRRLYHDQQDVSRRCYYKKDSFSIRCLKD